MKQLKACGARNLPSIDYGRNTASTDLASAWNPLQALHPADPHPPIRAPSATPPRPPPPSQHKMIHNLDDHEIVDQRE
jgi:hypothetical protein